MTIDRAIEIFEQPGRIYPCVITGNRPEDVEFTDENKQAMLLAYRAMHVTQKLEEFVQSLGIREPILTKQELEIYKKLRAIFE